MSDEYVFTFGKYEGMTIPEVAEENRKYLEWIVENFNDGPVKEKVEEYLENE